MAKASELKELSLADLQKTRGRIQGRIIQPTFPIGYWQLENTARIAQVRKDIARVKTVIRAQELANANK